MLTYSHRPQEIILTFQKIYNLGEFGLKWWKEELHLLMNYHTHESRPTNVQRCIRNTHFKR